MFLMESCGFKAAICKAAKLENTGRVHGLPPGSPIDVHSVDSFKYPRRDWIGGDGNYVVPVKSDWGLWFQWTMNDSCNTAVLPTVKGMNPITGRRTEGYGLEQYKERCPLHGSNFKNGLFCEDCGYQWAPQNYVSLPNTLWWDGFRTSDGKVRQFFFTEDMAKSVPDLVLGKHDAVPAFGFAFYKPKQPRKSPETVKSFRIEETLGFSLSHTSHTSNIWHIVSNISKTTYQPTAYHTFVCDSFTNTPLQSFGQASEQRGNKGISYCGPVATAQCASYASDSFKITDVCDGINHIQERCLTANKALINASVGVGAGAEIAQDLRPDPLGVEDWESEPSAVIRLHFVFEDEFAEIAKKGMKDFSGFKEGFLQGLPVGG